MSSYSDSRFQSNRASLGRRSTNGSSRPSSIIDDTQPRSRRGSALFGTFGDEDIQGAVGWPIAARLANEEPIDETIVETEKPKNWRDPHLFYIFPTVFFFSAAFNLSGPCVYWALHDLYNGNEALAGQTNGALTGVYTAFTLIGGPIWAVISNRIGRKIVIVISILSAILDCGIFIWKDVPVPVLYVSKVSCGSTFSFFTVASAYVSDVSTPSNRAFGFSMIWVCYSVGNIGLPISAGYLLNTMGTQMGFVSGVVIQGINLLYVFFFLPDVKVKNPKSFSWREMTPWWPFRILFKKWYVVHLLNLFYLVSFSGVGLGISGLNMWESHIWHWDKLKIGIVSSVLSCLMLIQAPINRWLIPNSNRWLVIVSGTLFYFTTCCILVVITHIEWGDGKAWLLLLSTFTFAVAGSILPAMQGMISEEFDDESQGEVAGVAMAVRGLAYTVASPINGYTWRVFISPNESPNWGIYVPSIIFVISGIVSLISFAYSLMIFVWYQSIQKRGEHEEEGYQAITIHKDSHSYKDKS